MKGPFPESADLSVSELAEQARVALGRRSLDEAEAHLVGALGQTHAREDEYREALDLFVELARRRKEPRKALTLLWYAGTDDQQKALLADVPPIDRARTLMAWAERDPGERGRAHLARAAEELEGAGLVARAAVARERAEDFAGGRALWSRLSQQLASSGGDLYAAGLARFNLARTAKRCGDRAMTREATMGAVHLLEEAADRHEQAGLRERAFDCFQVLIAIGRESDTFEHVLEGYVNVVRILREDSLRYYAIQTYEEAIEAARAKGESAAAATLAREMSAYAKKEGLPQVNNHGILLEADLWREVARRTLARGGPPEIAENALLAAVLSYGEVGQFRRVGDLYAELAVLPLEDSRRRHYTRASGRYAGARDERAEASALPSHLRHQTGYPEVWHVDLLEWEAQGSASEACADVLLDRASWSEVTRRRAMLGRLVALDTEGDPKAQSGGAIAVAEQLSRIELYAVLAPLEHLFSRPEPAVRARVVEALSRFLFKRTFITIRAALADPAPEVAAAAAAAVEELHFPHAHDALARIYRESAAPTVRASALRAIARIDTVEAAEMLLDVVEHGGPAERSVAVSALKRAPSTKFVKLAKEQLGERGAAVSEALREVLEDKR